MNLEDKIEKQKEKIELMQNELLDLDFEISDIEKEIEKEKSNANDGVFMMSSSAMRPLGAFEFISSSDKADSLSSKLSKLKSKKEALELSIIDEEIELSMLERDLEYEKRPDVVLYEENNGVYIEGDKSKTNIVSGLEEQIKNYETTYQNVLQSKDVEEFERVKNEVSDLVKKSDLPEYTHERRVFFRDVRRRSGLESGLGYSVIEDRIVADGDFISPAIEREKKRIKSLERKLEDNKKKRDAFKPKGLGKIFKGVRNKQQSSWNIDFDLAESEYDLDLQISEKTLERFEEAKKMFIDPLTPIASQVNKLNQLYSSGEVKIYLNQLGDYERNIKGHTILKSTHRDAVGYMISEIKPILDRLGKKLSKEQLADFVKKSKLSQAFKTEILNAVGAVKSSKKENQNEAILGVQPEQ